MDTLAAHIERQPRRPEDDAVSDVYLTGGSDKEAAAVAARVDPLRRTVGRLGRCPKPPRTPREQQPSRPAPTSSSRSFKSIAEPLIEQLDRRGEDADARRRGAPAEQRPRGRRASPPTPSAAPAKCRALYALRARISKRAAATVPPAPGGIPGRSARPRSSTSSAGTMSAGRAVHRRASASAASSGFPRAGEAARRRRGRRQARRQGEPDRATDRLQLASKGWKVA